MSRLRQGLNYLNGSTLLGLIIGLLGRARFREGPQGLILAEEYQPRFPLAAAFTVGDVVITSRSFDELADRLPRLLEHEARHCVQYALLGWFYLPLYVLGMGFSWVKTGDRGTGHPLEIWAGLNDGGYRQS